MGLFALALALSVSALYFGAHHDFSVQAIEDTIRSWGTWGVFASIGLMILHSFVPFPAEFLAIANGMVYGPLWGTAITWVGAMLGAFLAFGLARALGRPFVETVVAKERWRDLDDWTAARGGRLILFSRLIPVIAFNLVNYAAGLTRVSWWTYSWATGLGILPFTVLLAILGDFADVLAWEIWILVGASSVALWFASRGRWRPASLGKNRADTDPGGGSGQD